MQAHIIAFAKQRDLFQQLGMISNNVANVNSAGFKAELAVYDKSNQKVDGDLLPTPQLFGVTDYSKGVMSKTDRPLDIAIDGDTYFLVSTPLGDRYTKRGVFTTNEENTLVTPEGYQLVGDGGAVTIDPNDEKIIINSKGELFGLQNGVQTQRGVIQQYKFDDQRSLTKVGDSYFTSSTAAQVADPAVDYKLLQGFVEKSNVNQIEEITELIDISRSVASLARIVQDQQQLLRNAVTKITGTN